MRAAWPRLDLRVLGCLAVVVLGVAWSVDRAQPTAPTDGSAEAGFARDMAIHHAQAVDLAQTEQTRTDDDELRLLSSDIVLTQQAQIGQLRGWLDQWSLPATSTSPPMGWMGHEAAPEDATTMAGMDHGSGGWRSEAPHGTSSMPGMATAQELAGLRTAPTADADVAFLRLMVRHHEGGVLMARAILDRTDRPEVRSFAQAVVTSQRSEIRTLTTLLRRRGGTPAPPLASADHRAGDPGGGGPSPLAGTALRVLPAAAAVAAGGWLLLGRRPDVRPFAAEERRAEPPRSSPRRVRPLGALAGGGARWRRRPRPGPHR